MTNRHIKMINGRRYYYASIRRGNKVTSKYLGPVDERKRKPRKKEMKEEIKEEYVAKEELQMPEETYIG